MITIVATATIAAAMVATLAFAGVSRWHRDKPTAAPSTTASQPPPTVAFQPSPDSAYRSAWLPYWDDGTGLESFRQHASSFDEVHPFWYEAQSATTIALQGTAAFRNSVVGIARSHDVTIVPTITENMNTDALMSVLTDPTQRSQHVRAVCGIPDTAGYAGVDIDYETFALNVPAERVAAVRDAFTLFMKELADCLHVAGKTVQVTVLPHTDESAVASYLPSIAPGVFDYRALGEVVDILRPMAYDNATPLTAPSSTDPLPWASDVARYASQYVPARKVSLGIALYGYDWQPGRAASITARQATALARSKGATVTLDDVSQSKTFTYQADSATHTVWFDNTDQTRRRVDLAKEFGLAGVTYWALGSEDRDFWNTLP